MLAYARLRTPAAVWALIAPRRLKEAMLVLLLLLLLLVFFFLLFSGFASRR